MKIKSRTLRITISGTGIILLALRIAAQDIQVVTTTTTNLDTQTVRTKDIYTRAGMTNLVRMTSFKKGKLQIRLQQIYYNGELLGSIDDDNVNRVFGITAEPNRPYNLGFQFYSDRTLRSVAVGTNGVLVDAFNCTNGVLFPAETSTIKKANEIGADMGVLFAPTNVQGKSPKEFNRQVEKLIEKHKDK